MRVVISARKGVGHTKLSIFTQVAKTLKVTVAEFVR